MSSSYADTPHYSENSSFK